ncbi:hypothetical protein PLICRDRAFT_80609, partial [Plicaturopsis crispa FD-325 SS-3]
FLYVDDSFGFELADNKTWYCKYDQHYPAKQAALLELFDAINLPHEKKKQEFGAVLTIIGFEVDPNAMTFTMPADARQKFLELLWAFIAITPSDRRRSLRKFQEVAGYSNWAFNVFPLLKPGLSNLYEKMRGKDRPNAQIHINQAIIADLSWMAHHVARSDGVHVLTTREWGP